jgi:23S rRNA (cytidine1920-2'-O)/16S rRNA (cytidine1409-2'-O)-methyltransferase
LQNKIRLDQLIFELGYFDSKEKARSAIMQGCIKIAGKLIDKAGHQINSEKFYTELDANPSYIEVDDKLQRYVSRGAFKLEAAFKTFNLDFHEAIVLDVGASTGGFTDFTLQHGAKKVLALDVGKGQLHYKLQHDSRVVNLEGINFRNFSLEDLITVLDGVSLEDDKNAENKTIDQSRKLDFIVSDLSFISLTKVADRILEIAKHFNPRIILLLKPQFEASKEIADKFRGIITDEKIRDEIIKDLLEKLSKPGLQLKQMIESPIKGTKGNVEYLAEFEVGEKYSEETESSTHDLRIYLTNEC